MKQIGKRLASLVAALAVALSLCPLWGGRRRKPCRRGDIECHVSVSFTVQLLDNESVNLFDV